MDVAHLNDRFATMMTRTPTPLEKAPAGTGQQEEHAEQLFHTILTEGDVPSTNTG
jgi:hypothetical protein